MRHEHPCGGADGSSLGPLEAVSLTATLAGSAVRCACALSWAVVTGDKRPLRRAAVVGLAVFVRLVRL